MEGNHVVILGNGFDVSLNRHTKYSDFYKSNYCPKHYPAPLIKFLNGSSRDGNGNVKDLRWYDFENQLLDYYTSPDFKKEPLTDEEKQVIKELQRYHRPIRREDLEYTLVNGNYFNAFDTFKKKGYIELDKDKHNYVLAIDKIDDNIASRDFHAFSLIKDGLSSYLKSIIEDEKDESLFSLPFLKEKNIEVFTFNYTPVPFATPNNIHHVHGSCAGNNIIIGTREVNKITKDYWFLQKVYDPTYKPSYVSYALLDASRVSIFGHSLGENDRQYFQAFFKRQCDAEKAKPKMEIDIYTYDEDSKMEIKRALQELTEFHLSDLYQYNTLNIFTEEEYKNMFQ